MISKQQLAVTLHSVLRRHRVVTTVSWAHLDPTLRAPYLEMAGEIAIASGLDDEYDGGYQEGFDAGFGDGYNSGWDEGAADRQDMLSGVAAVNLR